MIFNQIIWRNGRWPLFLMVLFSLFNQKLIYAGEPGIYQEQGLHLIKAIHTMQVKHGRCKELEKDCVTKRLAFFGRSSSGIDIEVFETKEPHLIQDIFSVCLAEYELNYRKMDITLNIYHQPHEQMMGFSKLYKKPSIYIFFKGVN